MRTENRRRTQESSGSVYTRRAAPAPRVPGGDSGHHQMDPRFEALLRRQIAAGFQDLRGARADVTLPISDRLLNEVLAAALPPAAAIRDVEVRPRAGNRIGVRFRIAAASFLPPINISLLIER